MDYSNFKNEFKEYEEWCSKQDRDMWDNDEIENPYKKDPVNSPSHYTAGKTEAIDVIEDAIDSAPDVTFGFLQGQVLKYMLRLWLKENPLEDAKKARWYLNRLIEKGDSAW